MSGCHQRVSGCHQRVSGCHLLPLPQASLSHGLLPLSHRPLSHMGCCLSLARGSLFLPRPLVDLGRTRLSLSIIIRARLSLSIIRARLSLSIIPGGARLSLSPSSRACSSLSLHHPGSALPPTPRRRRPSFGPLHPAGVFGQIGGSEGPAPATLRFMPVLGESLLSPLQVVSSAPGRALRVLLERFKRQKFSCYVCITPDGSHQVGLSLTHT